MGTGQGSGGAKVRAARRDARREAKALARHEKHKHLLDSPEASIVAHATRVATQATNSAAQLAPSRGTEDRKIQARILAEVRKSALNEFVPLSAFREKVGLGKSRGEAASGGSLHMSQSDREFLGHLKALQRRDKIELVQGSDNRDNARNGAIHNGHSNEWSATIAGVTAYRPRSESRAYRRR